MKKLGIFLAALALIVLCLTLMPTEAEAASSGSCGAAVTWKLDDAGTLTISGAGNMKEYQWNYKAPWYESRALIKKVIIEKGVNTIGNFAFVDCTNLVSVIIPDTVTIIGPCAFKNCTSLVRVTIPELVQSISYNTFQDCTSLTEVILPDNVTDIGRWAFASCTSLAKINIPKGVTRIGQYAFYQCSSLTSFAFPKGVTTLEMQVLFDCTSLTSVTIPEGVTLMYDGALGNCSNLTSITIPGSVTEIRSCVFTGCTNLTSITIPEGVTKIFSAAFSGCDSLTSITIPASVTYIDNDAFMNCDRLKGIWVSENNTAYSNDASGVLFNKAKTILMQMPGGFSGAYTIPDGVTEITGSEMYSIYTAFSECVNLTSVTIPASVTNLGKCMFRGCTGLTSVTIPNTMTSIGDKVFQDCTSLTGVVIPNSVTSFGISVFSGCTSLTYISLPESVDSVVMGLFSKCSNLKQVLLPKGIKFIDSSAFADCTALTTVYYKGSKAEWEKIKKDWLCNECLKNATIIYAFEGNSIPGTCNHQWQAATCTTPKTCTACGATEGTVGQHTYNNGVITKPATCKEEGVKTYTCTVCNAPKTEKVEKSTTHTYDNTCDTTCNVCGEVRTITHNYQTAWSKDGTNHWHECSVCRNKTDLAAHTPGPEATETTAQTCTVCGYVIQPVLGHVHNYGDAWVSDPDGHWHACDGCEEKESYAAHTPGPEATATTDQTCTVCGYVLAEATGETTPPSAPSTEPATQPETKPGNTQPESKPVAPVTDGEPAPDYTIWIVAAIVFVIAGGVVGIIFWKKKH